VKLLRAQNVLARVVTFSKRMDHIRTSTAMATDQKHNRLHTGSSCTQFDSLATLVLGIISCPVFAYTAAEFVELVITAVTVDQNGYGYGYGSSCV